ncbi:MAG: ABC transporter permease [Bacteroidota bacterium]
MNLPIFVARRYLFAKKKRNVINLINWVALGGIAIGTAAILLVLSTLNGLSEFITNMYSAMDPDLKIVASTGRLIDQDEAFLKQLASIPNIALVSQTVEGKILLKYQEKQSFGVLKGVDSLFTQINPVDEHVYEGTYSFTPEDGYPRAVFAIGFPFYLGINLFDKIDPVELIYLPKKKRGLLGSTLTSLRKVSVFPSGFFKVQPKEYDEKYIISDLNFAQDFFSYENQVTAYEIKLIDPEDAEETKREVQAILPEKMEVLSWYDQHKSLYRVMRNEKFISYLILTLVIAIAAINIVGSLSMIVLEKSRDISVLKSMGATASLIRRIFLWEGVLIGGIGVALGVSIALILAVAQQQFALIYLEGSDLPFPISLQLNDFLLICFTVFFLCGLASLYPSYHAGKLEVIEGLKR